MNSIPTISLNNGVAMPRIGYGVFQVPDAETEQARAAARGRRPRRAEGAPLGRSSRPAGVAATVKFALANASITGTTLLVDGGQHLMRFERDFSLM